MNRFKLLRLNTMSIVAADRIPVMAPAPAATTTAPWTEPARVRARDGGTP